jgi:hypothetical protein
MDRCVKVVEGTQSRGDGGAKPKDAAIDRTPEQGNIPSVIDEDVGMSPRCGTARMRRTIFPQVRANCPLHTVVRPPFAVGFIVRESNGIYSYLAAEVK